MLVLLGKISSSINMSETTCSSRRAEQKVRERLRTNYWLEGHQICRDTFKFVHGFVIFTWMLYLKVFLIIL
jgi:hypothetical protein